MSSYQKLLKTGQKLAKKAKELDDLQQYEEAQKKYIEAADCLAQFIRINRNAQIRPVIEEKIAAYIKRAKQLRGIEEPDFEEDIEEEFEDDSEEGDEDKPKKKKKLKLKGDPKLTAAIADTIVTEKPDIKWEDVANLEAAKQALREAIILPMVRPDLFKGARKPWRGILLYGPPGCGKTMIAKAVANECDATFFNADAASLVSKWLGESERLIKELFNLARQNSPALIFMDEIDSLTTSRGGSGSEGGGERRIKTQLLQEIDGMKSEGQQIVMLGATNTPWEIDAAMRRRFEKRIYIGLPEFEARKVLFQLHTKGVDLDEAVNFEELAFITDGYSGSDIALVCRESIMNPIRELDMSGDLQDATPRPVIQQDFLESLKGVKPSVSKKELKKYEDWANEFGSV
ncbi:MAG: AAA family ATPase [Candidatus Helarchaeota archaeon]